MKSVESIRSAGSKLLIVARRRESVVELHDVQVQVYPAIPAKRKKENKISRKFMRGVPKISISSRFLCHFQDIIAREDGKAKVGP